MLCDIIVTWFNYNRIAREDRMGKNVLITGKINTYAAAFLLGLVIVAVAPGYTAYGAEPTDQQVLVDKAVIALNEFQAAPEMSTYRDALKDAKGVLVVPGLFKGGILLGGSGGKGVYLDHDPETGAWRGPAFYNMGSFTVGLQIGAEVAEVVVLAMTDDAVKAMLSPQFKLGGDFSLAAGPVGGGVAGGASMPAAAFVSFAMAKGVYAGLTLEGAVVTVDDEANTAYYGRHVEPEDILMTGQAVSPAGEGLREAVSKAGRAPE